jgi:hypothetical protein
MTNKYKEKQKKKSRREKGTDRNEGKEANSLECREETEGKLICLQYCTVLYCTVHCTVPVGCGVHVGPLRYCSLLAAPYWPPAARGRRRGRAESGQGIVCCPQRSFPAPFADRLPRSVGYQNIDFILVLCSSEHFFKGPLLTSFTHE